MAGDIDIRSLRRVPNFAGLDGAELNGLRGGLRLVSFAEGAVLVAQGDARDGTYYLESGAVDIVTRIPGGGEKRIATLPGGSMVGDMGLIDAGRRTASARATAAGRAIFLERAYFRGMLAQRSAPAMKILRTTLGFVCRRVRDVDTAILAAEGPRLPPWQPAGEVPRRPGGSDLGAYLPRLPFFAGFAAADVSRLAGMGRLFELPRGATLFAEGVAARTCFLVVRGAVTVWGANGGARRPLAVLGPGRAAGLAAMILGGENRTVATVHEGAAVLALEREVFDHVYGGASGLSLAFLEAVSADLLHGLARRNNDLTRLSGQELIRQGYRSR